MTNHSTAGILIDDMLKGVPWGTGSLPIGEIGARKWNVLNEDLPLPLAVLKQSALDNNSTWMRHFLEASNAVLAPHGKTTMCPQLFERQLADGAWAITLANAAQMQVARRFGISRIFLANQLIGRQAIDFVIREMRVDPGFDFYCLADSIEGVELLADAARKGAIGRPLQVLVEGGVTGGRTGARTLARALKIARKVKEASPYLVLRGVEGFEGVIHEQTAEETRVKINGFLDFLGDVALACDAENLFGPGPVILTAGSSAYYDLVADAFSAVKLTGETLPVIRSGCYLTHDSIMYEMLVKQLRERSGSSLEWGHPPQAALEIWAYAQWRPEPGRVIFALGKRDASYDAGLPVALAWARPGRDSAPRTMPPGHVSVEVNDQHLFMDVPHSSPLEAGDMVGFGISHPCLTFDKWQFIPIIDDAYTVVRAVRTFF